MFVFRSQSGQGIVEPTQIDEIGEKTTFTVNVLFAEGRINIRFAEVGEAVVRLYDMTGRLVFTSQATTQAFVIPTQGMAKGIYTLVTIFGAKQQVHRVVVE